MYETAAMPSRLPTALLIAILCHALVLGLLAWPQTPQPSTSHPTLQVRISSPAFTAPALPDTSLPPRELETITSLEGDPGLWLQLPDQLPSRARDFQSPSSDTAWIGTWFSSSTPVLEHQDASPDQVTRLSTSELPPMSPYQRQLLEILGRNQYHDAQYAFSRLQQERRVRLRLRLLSNGALVRTDILQSSGDRALDLAAQRSAYAASPFPPPPAEDASLGYTYTVDIQYQPRSNRR